jgi:isoleucyl-tRNA synthetase
VIYQIFILFSTHYDLKYNIIFGLFSIFSIYLEKYLQLDHTFTQLDKKCEDLSKENLNLKTRIEALDKENRDKQINSQLQSNSKQINSQRESESKQTEENEREKEEYYESHPDLETMADAVKSNSNLKEATTNKVNENTIDGIYKERRLFIDSGKNIIYLLLKGNLLNY